MRHYFFFLPEAELGCHPAVFWLGAAAIVLIFSFFGFLASRLPLCSLLAMQVSLGLMVTLCDMRRVASALVQQLHFDEFVACSFRLVPVKWRGQHFRMHISFLDHTRAGFIQRSLT
jgi:hypothetical protein